MNRFYPISFNLSNKLCLVVGGGPVALRRVTKLLESGARVKVISPHLEDKLKEKLEGWENMSWTQAHYSGCQDLKGACLVFAASNDPSLNKSILKDAQSLGILANVASHGHLGDFIIPASFDQGDLQVTVSTNAKVPGLSKAIKEDLKELLNPSYALLINLLEDVRKLAITDSGHKAENLQTLSHMTRNYLYILEQLESGVSPDHISKELLSRLK